MNGENGPTHRFPWSSLAWSLGGGLCLPVLTATFFSITYDLCRGHGLDYYYMFGPADESSGIGVIIIFMYHAPIGCILGAVGGYCWGMAKQRFMRRAYLVSHWSGLLLGAPALAVTGLNLMGACKGWLLFAFLSGGVLLSALFLLCLSYRFHTLCIASLRIDPGSR